MKDLFGKTVKVGDRVVYAVSRGRSAALSVGRVVEILAPKAKGENDLIHVEIEKGSRFGVKKGSITTVGKAGYRGRGAVQTLVVIS